MLETVYARGHMIVAQKIPENEYAGRIFPKHKNLRRYNISK